MTYANRVLPAAASNRPYTAVLIKCKLRTVCLHVLVTFGNRVLAAAPGGDPCAAKYKGIWACLNFTASAMRLQVLVTYGNRVLAAAPGGDPYAAKYKGIWVCLMILSRALSGNYVNFGVFDLYGDPALKVGRSGRRHKHLCFREA